jgi:hypothetical protein
LQKRLGTNQLETVRSASDGGGRRLDGLTTPATTRHQQRCKSQVSRVDRLQLDRDGCTKRHGGNIAGHESAAPRYTSWKILGQRGGGRILQKLKWPAKQLGKMIQFRSKKPNPSHLFLSSNFSNSSKSGFKIATLARAISSSYLSPNNISSVRAQARPFLFILLLFPTPRLHQHYQVLIILY